jgi:hypothetical protein
MFVPRMSSTFDDKLHLLIPMLAVTGTAKICGRIGHKLAEVLFRAQDDL